MNSQRSSEVPKFQLFYVRDQSFAEEQALGPGCVQAHFSCQRVQSLLCICLRGDVGRVDSRQ